MNDQELRIVVSAKDSASSVIKKVQNELRGASSSMRQGLDQAKRSADSYTDSAAGAAKSNSTFGATFGAILASQVVTKVASAIRSAGAAAIESAASYEQSRVAFETMLGSADKARTMMGEIAAFAKSTPFELPEVVAGSKQLLAFGYAQEQIIPTMRKIGDIAAGVGVPVGQLTTVFGQVRVAGRLMGQDLLQFTNAGVPMIEALAAVMKKPQKEIKDLIEKGKVGFEDVQKALDYLTGSGSKFGGMMEKQSKTFSGVVSNIKDGFGQILRNAVGITVAGDIIENGLFDRIKKGAESALPYIARLTEQVGPAMGRLMTWIDGVTRSVEQFALQAATYLMPKLQELWAVVQAELIPVLTRLWREVLEPLIPVIGVSLVLALGLAVDSIRVMVSAVSEVVNRWLSAVEAARNFYERVAYYFELVKQRGQSVVDWYNSLPNGLRLAFNGIVDAIFGPFDEAFGLIIRGTERVIGAINNVKRAGQSITDGVPNSLVNTALSSLLKVPGFAPFRATGGAVSEGRPYIVGERQAEVFVPNSQGRILPNAPQGSSVTNVLSGTFNFHTAEAVGEFMNRIDQTQRLALVGMA